MRGMSQILVANMATQDFFPSKYGNFGIFLTTKSFVSFSPKKTLVRNQQISKICHTSLLVAILQRRKKPDSGVG
jgi:hypothetical protein